MAREKEANREIREGPGTRVWSPAHSSRAPLLQPLPAVGSSRLSARAPVNTSPVQAGAASTLSYLR